MKILSYFDKKKEIVSTSIPSKKEEQKIRVLVLDQNEDLLSILKEGKYSKDLEMVFSTDETLVLRDMGRYYDAILADVDLKQNQLVDKKLRELAADMPVYRMSEGRYTNNVNVVLQKPFTLDVFERKIKEIRGLALYLKKTA